jgi:hypothetical protein
VSSWREALDLLAGQAGAAVGAPATRDPSAVAGLAASESGGCVLVGMPTQVLRLLAGPNLEVPVSLVTAAPSDLRAVDWLLDHMDQLCAFTGARNPTIGPIDIGSNTYPAVTATVQLTVTTQEA